MSEEYESTITARPNFTRDMKTTKDLPNGTNRVVRVVTTESRTSNIISGLGSPYGQNVASTIRDSREREKKEMCDLNDKLANYIEKVRFLEAQNRKLAGDLKMLTSRAGQDSSKMQTLYERELETARKLITDTSKQQKDLEGDIRKLQDQLAEFRNKYDESLQSRTKDREHIDDLLVKLSTLEAEIALLKRRIALLEEETGRIKKENFRLQSELQRVRTELDQETLNRIDYQNQVQTLLEEIDFIRRVNDQEIKELQAMAARDTTNENREFFRNELASAIRDIRAEYDQMMNNNRSEMDSWYTMRVQEIQTASNRQNLEHGYAKEEVKRLRTQLGDMRGKLADLEGRNALLEQQVQQLNYQLEDDQRTYEAALNDRDAQIRKMREECQALMVELQMLLDTKQTLDSEIALYRKMLEGTENGNDGLKQIVEQVVRTHRIGQTEDTEQMRIIKGETATRSSYSRSAKGNVSIHETSPEGKFVVLVNTNRAKEEAVGGWKLKRKIDGKREILYTLPNDFILQPGKSVKIWARGHGGIINPPESLVSESEDSFGIGSNVQTILYNKEGEERAMHTQRSSQTTQATV